MLNLERIKAFKLGTYGMNCNELCAFMDYLPNDPWNAIVLAYTYGFIRGQNSIRNQRKKKAPATARNSDQGSPQTIRQNRKGA